MKKILVVFVLLISVFTIYSEEIILSEEEILPLPAWNITPRKRVDRRLQLRNFISLPPSGVIYTPAEYAEMEGVIIQVPSTMPNLRKYYAEMIVGIIDAGAIPYIIADSDNSSFWQTVNDIKHITDNVLVPNNIDPMQVVFLDTKYNANWTRDYGPYHTYINGDRAIVNNEYYEDRADDNAFNYVLAELWDESIYSTGLSTEGGNFMTDGLGTCWTSTGTLQANMEYYGWTEQEVSDIYYDYLNCYNGVYYPEPLVNEGTTHIDMFSKILDQNTIIVGSSSIELGAEQDEIESLDAAAQFYEDTPKPDGGKWNIVRIPMTFDTISYGWGKSRVQYTHTNSTIVNDHVLVPVYNRGTDEESVAIYQELMPNHIIVPINSNAIITSGGAIHCTTMQVPVKKYSRCGDGVIEEEEECDLYFLNGASCENLGYDGGMLKCRDDCSFDTTGCFPNNSEGDDDQAVSDEDSYVPDDDIPDGEEIVDENDEETVDEESIWEDDKIEDLPEKDVRRKTSGCTLSVL
jgi:agmatine deiminase